MGYDPIYIYELDWHGHRLTYVRHAVELAGQGGRPAVVITDSVATTTSEWSSLMGGLPDDDVFQVLSHPQLSRRPTLRARLRNATTILQLTRIAPNAPVVILNADEMLLPLVLTGALWRRPWRLLIMRSVKGGLRIKAIAKRAVLRLAATPARTKIFRLESPLGPDASIRGAQRVVLDPVVQPEPRPAATQIADQVHRLQAKGPLASVLGRLDSRKHVAEILAAHKAFAHGERAFSLIAAGASDAETRDILATYEREADPSTFCWINGFLAANDFTYLLSEADVALLLYDNEVGSSGVLGEAALARTPIIGFGNRTVCHAVDKWSLGVVIRDLSATTIAEAVSEASGMTREMRLSLPPAPLMNWRETWTELVL